jgi:hypothetical protein
MILLKKGHIIRYITKIPILNWSERSACAARALLQTGCVVNVVATKFIVFGPSEVCALPVRRCRQAAWQTQWPLSSLLVRAKCVRCPCGVADGLRGKHSGH